MQRAEAAIRAAREQLGANRLADLDAPAADPLGHGERLRQAHVRLRVPGDQRGGQGIINIETSRRNGPVVAAFPSPTTIRSCW